VVLNFSTTTTSEPICGIVAVPVLYPIIVLCHMVLGGWILDEDGEDKTTEKIIE